MSPRLTTDAALAALAALAISDASADIEAELHRLLVHKSNHVAAKAVALAQERRVTAVVPELSAAFAFFMKDCVKADPGCSAKLAIVNCLTTFGEPEWEVYLAGVRHVQKEPAFGPPVDTAATLRAMCGRALMALGHHDAFRWHALLIADPEPMTRALAVETLGSAEDERAELLLRTKIVREPEAREPERGIEMDAFDALMHIAPGASFDFVAAYLRDADLDRVHGAALALGDTHLPEAFASLRACWDSAVGRPGIREAIALPIALLRSADAFAFLLDALVSAPIPLAEALIEALALYRESPERAADVRRVVEHRANRTLAQCFRKNFDRPSAENAP